MKLISFFASSFNEPIEFSKVRVPVIIHNFANPTINQSFLSITVIFTCEADREFLNSLAAEKPPKNFPLTALVMFVLAIALIYQGRRAKISPEKSPY